MNNELKNDRCANAFDCYIKLKRDLTKRGDGKKWTKLLEYESSNDARVLKNTTLTTKCTYIGFATEKKEQYDQLVAQNYEHIVFTDREIVPDCQPIAGTLKVAQVQGFKEK